MAWIPNIIQTAAYPTKEQAIQMHKTTSDIKMLPITTSLLISQKLKQVGIKQGYSDYFWSNKLWNFKTRNSQEWELFPDKLQSHVDKEDRCTAFTREELQALWGKPIREGASQTEIDLTAHALLCEIEDRPDLLAAANNRLHRWRCSDTK